ncbi:alpha/beta hydrolase [Candidatus Nomurabacteria bacterium]|nr:alpha/beta hydrolase [Candidatus Nomurabacteria bacterium]USN95114.1 MAG: alpha/beta hydrolase [Candidatus Nomurabacteria bacterium]
MDNIHISKKVFFLTLAGFLILGVIFGICIKNAKPSKNKQNKNNVFDKITNQTTNQNEDQNSEDTQNDTNDTNQNNDNNNTGNSGPTKTNGQYASQTITYGSTGSSSLKFDLNIPKGSSNPPVIVWIHGGAFGPGGLNAADGYIDDFAKEGYAIAEVAYRSVLDGLFPSQIQDVKGAVRYLRANASSLGIDGGNIFALGTSSGGMTVSLLGTSCGVAELEGTTGGNTGYSSCVDGVVNLFGSLTVSQITDISDSVLPNLYGLFGCAVGSSCPDMVKTSSAYYLDAGDPPFLIIHGDADQTVPIEQSQELYSLMTAAGIDVTFITAPGAGHDKDTIITNYFDEIISFLNNNYN